MQGGFYFFLWVYSSCLGRKGKKRHSTVSSIFGWLVKEQEYLHRYSFLFTYWLEIWAKQSVFSFFQRGGGGGRERRGGYIFFYLSVTVIDCRSYCLLGVLYKDIFVFISYIIIFTSMMKWGILPEEEKWKYLNLHFPFLFRWTVNVHIFNFIFEWEWTQKWIFFLFTFFVSRKWERSW